MKLLICATQFKGGSLQVVISLINEFRKHPENEYHVIVSESVSRQVDITTFPPNYHFYEYPYSGPTTFSSKTARSKFLSSIEEKTYPDCVVTTSGPLYWHAKVPVLMGFNLPNNIYEDSPFFKMVTLRKRFKWWFKKQIHRYYFRRDATAYFVQTDDVNQRLRKYIGRDEVYTVSNTCNNFFINRQSFPNKLPEKQAEEIRMLTVSTWYPHKNFEIIKPVLKELEKRGLSNIRFVLTLKKEHYERIFGEEYMDKVVNVGPVPAAECPSLYEECDYMFLPTLLECFSASYAEAMIMEKPILTSNLGFATVVCKDAAVYFDAINPIDIADKIERLVTNPALQRELIEKGKKQLSQFGSAEDRANQILELCRKITKK